MLSDSPTHFRSSEEEQKGVKDNLSSPGPMAPSTSKTKAARVTKNHSAYRINPIHEKWKAAGLELRPYQEDGVRKMVDWYFRGRGGINADEMGLGKTCQSIVTMMNVNEKGHGPFLVIAPLSVCHQWKSEIERFSLNSLEPILLTGNEHQRTSEISRIGVPKKNMVFITAHHLYRSSSNAQWMRVVNKIIFSAIFVDEAVVVKNEKAILSTRLAQHVDQSIFFLLTGTPVQNCVDELHSLLMLADRNRFAMHDRNDFIEKYSKEENVQELKKILRDYMFRRSKDEVCKELPDCDQVVLYHGLNPMQKELYLNLITQNLERTRSANISRTQSVLMDLRKCTCHPYIFPNIEPKPFVEGEHLVEASGKLQLLDRLLKYMIDKGHYCLIFSQFVTHLDIVEDMMNLRDYKYERFDGNTKNDERVENIQHFQMGLDRKRKGSRFFLLSTKAGGLGINLTAADTVIFLDSDWNPQNDIQAMARCHRIGQTRRVRVIRLIGRFTVEQYMFLRIRRKIKFSDAVIGNHEGDRIHGADLLTKVEEGLHELRKASSSSVYMRDEDLEKVIGKTTRSGEWEPLENDNDIFVAPDELDQKDVDHTDFMNYMGVSYRVTMKEKTNIEFLQNIRYRTVEGQDRPTFEQLRAEAAAFVNPITKFQSVSDRKSRLFNQGGENKLHLINKLPLVNEDCQMENEES